MAAGARWTRCCARKSEAAYSSPDMALMIDPVSLPNQSFAHQRTGQRARPN
jgi:hypothetical protein